MWGFTGRVVDTDFVVEVGTGAAAAFADVPDGIAAMHMLSRHDRKVRQVAITGGNAMAVVDHDGPSVAAQEIGKGDHAVGGRHDRLSVSRSDIDAAVESAFPVEGVNALAKRTGYRAFNRPEIGS